MLLPERLQAILGASEHAELARGASFCPFAPECRCGSVRPQCRAVNLQDAKALLERLDYGINFHKGSLDK